MSADAVISVTMMAAIAIYLVVIAGICSVQRDRARRKAETYKRDAEAAREDANRWREALRARGGPHVVRNVGRASVLPVGVDKWTEPRLAYPCGWCGTVFPRADLVVQHTRKDHPGWGPIRMTPREPDADHGYPPCSFCGLALCVCRPIIGGVTCGCGQGPVHSTIDPAFHPEQTRGAGLDERASLRQHAADRWDAQP